MTPKKFLYNPKIHGYWLDGKRCKNISTLAKLPEDSSSLDKWRQRMTAIGIARKPDLIERILKVEAERDALNDLCEEALVLARAHEAAERGTAAHDTIEKAAKGSGLTDDEAALWARFSALIAEAGYEMVPELVERCVVWPEHLFAGRWDHPLRHVATGRLVLADLKTGRDADRYVHAHCIQTGMYVAAPLMCGELAEEDEDRWSTSTFEPMPDFDKTRALIVHLPFEGPGSLVEVNIAAGIEAVHSVVIPTLQWRKRGNLAMTVATEQPPQAARRWQTFDVEEAGPDVDQETRDAIRAQVKFLSPEGQALVNSLQRQAHEHGCDLRLATRPSTRRFTVLRALLAFANAEADEDAVRACIGVVLGDELQPVFATGVALAHLTTEEAQRLGDLALALGESVQLRVTDVGTHVVGAERFARAS